MMRMQEMAESFYKSLFDTLLAGAGGNTIYYSAVQLRSMQKNLKGACSEVKKILDNNLLIQLLLCISQSLLLQV